MSTLEPGVRMGNPAVVCTRPPVGWYCTRGGGHSGPCPALPRWWNLSARRAMRGLVKPDGLWPPLGSL